MKRSEHLETLTPSSLTVISHFPLLLYLLILFFLSLGDFKEALCTFLSPTHFGVKSRGLFLILGFSFSSSSRSPLMVGAGGAAPAGCISLGTSFPSSPSCLEEKEASLKAQQRLLCWPHILAIFQEKISNKVGQCLSSTAWTWGHPLPHFWFQVISSTILPLGEIKTRFLLLSLPVAAQDSWRFNPTVSCGNWQISGPPCNSASQQF